jgi:hypothetical protein
MQIQLQLQQIQLQLQLNKLILIKISILSLSLNVTTDGQPSLSWNKAPFWGLRPDLYYCLTVAGLLIWGALFDERTGLSFTIAAGPCQRCLSRVRVSWDSRPYFTVSDLRLPFSSPPTTRRVTMEVMKYWFIHISPWPSVHSTSLQLRTPHILTTIYFTSLHFTSLPFPFTSLHFTSLPFHFTSLHFIHFTAFVLHIPA